MVLPIAIIMQTIVALLAVVRVTIVDLARDLVRMHLDFNILEIPLAMTSWAQVTRDGPLSLNQTFAFTPPPVYLQYSPISIWHEPPPPPSRSTCTWSYRFSPKLSPGFDSAASTAPLAIQPAPAQAPEATSFTLVERIVPRSTKQWCPSRATIHAVIDAAQFVLAIATLVNIIPALLRLAYAALTYLAVLVLKIFLYLHYRLALAVVAISRSVTPQIIWDVIEYRQARRRERCARL